MFVLIMNGMKIQMNPSSILGISISICIGERVVGIAGFIDRLVKERIKKVRLTKINRS